MSITIHSDDEGILHITGDIQEEWDVPHDFIIAISGGTLLEMNIVTAHRARRIRVLSEGAHVPVITRVDPGPPAMPGVDGGIDRSDTAVIEGPVQWVILIDSLEFVSSALLEQVQNRTEPW